MAEIKPSTVLLGSISIILKQKVKLKDQITKVTRTASNYVLGPSAPHTPQSSRKFAPKDEGLGAKVVNGKCTESAKG